MAENENTPTEPTTPPDPPPAGENQPPAEDQPTDAAGLRKALERERELRHAAEVKATQHADQLIALTRKQIARDKGLTDAQAELLQGKTEEELNAHADKLLGAFAKSDEPRSRPREKLRPGAVSDAEAPDFGSVADRVMRGG